jgi:hypothetical protein
VLSKEGTKKKKRRNYIFNFDIQYLSMYIGFDWFLSQLGPACMERVRLNYIQGSMFDLLFSVDSG